MRTPMTLSILWAVFVTWATAVQADNGARSVDGPLVRAPIRSASAPAPKPRSQGDVIAVRKSLAGVAAPAPPRVQPGPVINAPETDVEPPSPKSEEEVLAGHSRHGEAFNFGPRQSAILMGGTGTVQFAVTSSVDKVRAFVEQGIGQLYGYWYLEAERSFRTAAMLDPECAITYWGMALANKNNSKRSKAFIKEAMKRRSKASPRERMYIEALNQYIHGDRRKRNAAYVKALAAIMKRFPQDLEAKALYAQSLYRHRSSVKRSYEDVDRALRVVLKKQPFHPVHHFRIHLWDYRSAAKALDSAARCGQSAPAIAHMWHMPGHIYWRLKRYNDSAWQQEASARVDHAQMMRYRVLPDQIHNFAHNNEWLVRSLKYVGRHRDAAALAKNMIELPRHPKYNRLGGRGSANYGRRRLFEVLSQYEQWQALADACRGPWLAPTDIENEQIKRLSHLGSALAHLGDKKATDDVLAELRRRKATAAKNPLRRQRTRVVVGAVAHAAVPEAEAAAP